MHDVTQSAYFGTILYTEIRKYASIFESISEAFDVNERLDHAALTRFHYLVHKAIL
jgi:hypothetical protein